MHMAMCSLCLAPQKKPSLTSEPTFYLKWLLSYRQNKLVAEILSKLKNYRKYEEEKFTNFDSKILKKIKKIKFLFLKDIKFDTYYRQTKLVLEMLTYLKN